MNQADQQAQSRVESYRSEAQKTTTDGNEYNGLQIHAWRGLHDHLGRRLTELAPAGRRALDLAAGTGAMSLRLTDAGFEVVAVDLVSENFRLADRIAFKAVDLNRPFADAFDGRFDLVMAVELIEHLENPRHLFREIAKLLNPGGLFIVTTPNVNNPVSKAQFLHFGTLGWFTATDYKDRGHITPISRFQIEQCAAETGFEVQRIETFGDPFDDTKGWPKLRLLSHAIRLLSGETRETSGAVLVSILRRSGAQSASMQHGYLNKSA